MITGFVAKKLSMTNVYQDNGIRISATRCFCPDLTVTQIKPASIQIAYGIKKKQNQAVAGFLKKSKLKITPQHFKEFQKIANQPIAVGDQITIDSVFQPGETVNVTGISKGRGFAGVIKRYGFHRQPVSGGQSDRVRAPGAIGAQTPGKVLKGKKMPGHYGNATATVTGLKILSFDPVNHQVLINGPIPGHFNSWVIINKVKN